MLTDFQHSFTGRLSSKFIIKRYRNKNFPPYLKRVATLLAKCLCQKNSNNYVKYVLWLTTHYKILQRRAVGVAGVLYHYFITNLLLSLLWKNSKIGQHWVKLRIKKVDCLTPCVRRVIHYPAECWEMKNSPRLRSDVWRQTLLEQYRITTMAS